MRLMRISKRYSSSSSAPPQPSPLPLPHSQFLSFFLSFFKSDKRKTKMAARSYFYKHRTPYSADPNFVERRFPDVIQRSGDASGCGVICIRRKKDCLLWFAGLNSPAWGGGVEKLPDTSYDNHRAFAETLCSSWAMNPNVDRITAYNESWDLLERAKEIGCHEMLF